MSKSKILKKYELTYSNEVSGSSGVFHHPTKTSGVTIGCGFDFKEKDFDYCYEVFKKLIPMTPLQTAVIKMAIGLSGDEASDFVKEYDEVIVLDNNEQAKLFEIISKDYEDKTISDYNKMFEGYKQVTPFLELPPSIKDILFDFTYNLGTINKFPKFFKALLTGDRKGAMDNYMRYSGGVPLGRRNKDTKKVLDGVIFRPYNIK